DDGLVGGGTKSSAEHVESKLDPEPNWPQPTHLKYTWNLNGKDGKSVTASLEYKGDRRERVDIMGEVPAVVKKIIGGVAGTKPYIYPVYLNLRRGRNRSANGAIVCFQEYTSQDQDWRRGNHRGG